MAGLLADAGRYINGPSPDFTHDGFNYQTAAMWLTDAYAICALTCPNDKAIIRAQIAGTTRAVARGASSASERRR